MLAVMAGAWLVVSPAWAVIVFTKNSDEPVRGFLISENSIRIVIDELLPSGERREVVFPKVAVEDIIRAVDAERLAALSPDKPEAYRNYAEDLAAKTKDPEAQVAAIHLYLLAASLAPEELGRSCLIGMAALARTPEEERAFNAMAYLLDPDHDASLLKPTKLVASNFVTIKESYRLALRRAIQLLRSGRVTEARSMLRRSAVEEAEQYYSHIVSAADYESALNARGRLPSELLRKLLTLEITLSEPVASDHAKPETTELIPWSRLLSRGEVKPVRSLTLATITEFDPRACVFRNGKWAVPALK